MSSGAGSTVLEVGPDTVRVRAGGAGRPVSAALTAAALDWIDDPVGLLGETPVAVADLWHAVMAGLTGRHCPSVVVVHPPDWPSPRIDRVLAAANCFADRVVAVSRTEWTPAGAQPDPREERLETPRPRRRRWRLPVAAAVLGVLAVLAGVAGVVLLAAVAPPHADPGPQVLVEGRVEVRVPAQWTVERITRGPGSRRVQISSASESDVALHITQSYETQSYETQSHETQSHAPETTLADAAEVIGRAIAGQEPGVFVDFQPADVVAGRPAVTYREMRPNRVIRWAVLPVGAIRIGIGCQSPPAREDAVRAACEEAVRSARDAGTERGRRTSNLK